MTKQLTDTALRALVAQWTRAALGELVEDHSIEEERPTGELPAPALREKEESNAYPGS